MSHRTSVPRTTVVLAALVTALAPAAVLTGAATATGVSPAAGPTQAAAAVPAAPSDAQRRQPVARGRGGAVSSVDLDASRQLDGGADLLHVGLAVGAFGEVLLEALADHAVEGRPPGTP